MKQILQLDNVVSFNAKKERKKALMVLEKAKKINKPTVFLPKGFSYEIEKLKKQKLKKSY